MSLCNDEIHYARAVVDYRYFNYDILHTHTHTHNSLSLCVVIKITFKYIFCVRNLRQNKNNSHFIQLILYGERMHTIQLFNEARGRLSKLNFFRTFILRKVAVATT